MQSVCAFFGVDHSKDLTWCHSVNTPSFLATACADPRVNVLVTDVVLDASRTLPMVAHPIRVDDQFRPGELSLEDWLFITSAYQKAAKLDLHTAAAVKPVLELLNREAYGIPVILHADVFTLLDPTDIQFDPEQFVKLAQQYYPQATLSIGWSLRHGQDPDGKLEPLLIEQMAELLLKKLGGVAYHLEIRAGYTPAWEKGAAIFLDPIDGVARPIFNENVIDAIAHFRSDVFAGV